VIEVARQDLRYVAAAIGVAIIVGASSVVSPWLPILVVLAGGLLVAGLLRPVVLVPVAFTGILWSNAGLFEPVSLGVNITLGKMTMAGVLAIWALHAALYERRLFEPSRLTMPMVTILVVMVASLAWAAEIRNEFGVSEIVGFAMLVVMFHWVITVVDEASLAPILRAIGAILVPVMAWTLWNTPDMMWWDEYERAAGVYDNANLWCAILLLVCPLLIAFFVEDDHWTSPALLSALTVLLPLNIVASLSRSGFVSFAAITPFLGWLLWRRKWWVLAGTVVVFALTPAFADFDRVVLRYQSLVDPSLQEVDGSLTDRSIAARAGIQLFFAHPLGGVGVGMFMPAAREATSGAMTLLDPHNTYVGVASEQGLLGLAVHGWFAWVVGHMAWLNVRNAPPGMLRSLSVGFAAALVGIATMALGARYMTFPVLYIVLGLGVVLSQAVARAAREASDTGDAPEVVAAPPA